MVDVCKKYRIPRSSLKEHYEGRTKGRKMGPKIILTKEEEAKLVEYIELMVYWGHPMTSMQVKNKVAEIIQEKETPFKEGILRNSWLKLFRSRHLELVLNVPQGLYHKRAKAINPTTTAEFYANLQSMYEAHHYPPTAYGI